MCFNYTIQKYYQVLNKYAAAQFGISKLTLPCTVRELDE